VPVYRQELTPVLFLERSGTVHATRVAVTDGDVSYTWSEFRARARRFASALRASGLRAGDRACEAAPRDDALTDATGDST